MPSSHTPTPHSVILIANACPSFPMSLQAGRDASSKALAPATAVVDDRLYVFEAVGLLLGQEEVRAEEQAAALGALLTPLTAQVCGNVKCARLSWHLGQHRLRAAGRDMDTPVPVSCKQSWRLKCMSLCACVCACR